MSEPKTCVRCLEPMLDPVGLVVGGVTAHSKAERCIQVLRERLGKYAALGPDPLVYHHAVWAMAKYIPGDPSKQVQAVHDQLERSRIARLTIDEINAMDVYSEPRTDHSYWCSRKVKAAGGCGL